MCIHIHQREYYQGGQVVRHIQVRPVQSRYIYKYKCVNEECSVQYANQYL